MAHKTFISYKYSESRILRDRIIRALGSDAQFYQGETSESPNLTDTSTQNIKKVLTDMMFDTSVTIVILSPHMIESKWIPWEIEYCLKKTTRKERTSQTNGIVGVIQKVDGGYDWLKYTHLNIHGTIVYSIKDGYLPKIISQNMFNSEPKKIHCSQCDTYDYLYGSYISVVEEEEFLQYPQKYIENAYDKSENDAFGYRIEI